MIDVSALMRMICKVAGKMQVVRCWCLHGKSDTAYAQNWQINGLTSIIGITSLTIVRMYGHAMPCAAGIHGV
jgi:acetone carboxylase gamma subunit